MPIEIKNLNKEFISNKKKKCLKIHFHTVICTLIITKNVKYSQSFYYSMLLGKEEMNHIYKHSFHKQIDASLTIPNGSQYQNYKGEIELYEKSLALSSDLKRLPIIRALETVHYAKSLIDNICDAGVSDLTILIQIFNGKKTLLADDWDPEDYVEDEDLIYYSIDSWSFNTSTKANITAVGEIHEGGYIPKESSILGRNKITIFAQLTAAGNTSAALTYSDIVTIAEIDWQSVSKKQVQEYIMEDYFREDED